MEDFPRSVGFHPASRRVVWFAGFRADLADMSLWRDSEEVRLPPRVLGVLFYLLERPGRVVTKTALLDDVWKDAHVSETSLTEAVGILRQALGDDAQHPRFIQTVHRRGYRFVAPLSFEGPAAELTVVRPAMATPSADLEALPSRTATIATLRFAALVAGIAVVFAVIAAIWWRSSADRSPATVARVTITLPPDQAPAPALNANPVAALSPDGQRLVYVAGSTGAYRLLTRRIDQFEARDLPATEDGHGPFFSPDGKHVAFFAKGRLKRLTLDGGEALALAEAGSGLGGWWSRDGRIVFAKGALDGLWEVSAGGGTARLVVPPPDAASGYRWPQVLPDGDTIIATWWRSNARDAAVVLISRRTGAHRVLAAPASYGRILGRDTLVFVRDGALMAARFANGAIASLPRAVIDGVLMGLTGAGQFTTSDTGDLLYIPEDPERAQRLIVQASLDGAIRPSALPARAYQNLAACGNRVAVSVLEHGVSDIWLGDLARGTLTRLTDQGTNIEPVWQPDCRAVVFASSRDGVLNLYAMKTDDGGMAQRLQESELVQTPTSTSADGKQLIYMEISPKTRADIWRRQQDGHREPVLTTNASESTARASPDGRWIAYQVDDRGTSEVFVAPADGASPRVLVSIDGGSSPAWSADSRRLYYRRRTEVLGADISGSQAPIVGAPRVVLKHPDLVVFRVLGRDSFLLVLRRQEHLPLTKLLVVLNWTSEVTRLLNADDGAPRSR